MLRAYPFLQCSCCLHHVFGDQTCLWEAAGVVDLGPVAVVVPAAEEEEAGSVAERR